MKIVFENLARDSLKNIYYYNSQISLKNAIETDRNIRQYIHCLEELPYIGKNIPEIENTCFYEIIYKKTNHSRYRIMYYIAEFNKTIHIINIISTKQDFNRILKLHKYFNL